MKWHFHMSQPTLCLTKTQRSSLRINPDFSSLYQRDVAWEIQRRIIRHSDISSIAIVPSRYCFMLQLDHTDCTFSGKLEIICQGADLQMMLYI